ncbi:uncharacterized protein DUF1049 [Kitasatospora cineracea]|uniref:Uncharacterized protein DUF1049 n=2 Tax=Streptomycetaceae TaxID=2062 RepID=A0A3N4RZI2_9ACTN|nr:uncharacterized protein DUF1049 [Kitasatospora cineracea]
MDGWERTGGGRAAVGGPKRGAPRIMGRMADKTRSADRPASVTVGGRDVRFRTIAFLVLGILAVWFIAVNTASVSIRLWIPTVTLPLWLVLLVTLLVGAALGGLLARRRTKG